MPRKDYIYLIGEKIKVDGEKEVGVVTSVDEERGLIYVLFKRMRQQIFAYPESIDQGLLTPFKQPGEK